MLYISSRFFLSLCKLEYISVICDSNVIVQRKSSRSTNQLWACLWSEPGIYCFVDLINNELFNVRYCKHVFAKINLFCWRFSIHLYPTYGRLGARSLLSTILFYFLQSTSLFSSVKSIELFSSTLPSTPSKYLPNSLSSPHGLNLNICRRPKSTQLTTKYDQRKGTFGHSEKFSYVPYKNTCIS